MHAHFSDRKDCVSGVEQGSELTLAGPNCDLWPRRWSEYERHRGCVEVRKLPAHCTYDDVRAGLLTQAQCIGNICADGLAGSLAEVIAVRVEAHALVSGADKRDWRIRTPS